MIGLVKKYFAERNRVRQLEGQLTIGLIDPTLLDRINDANASLQRIIVRPGTL